MAIYSVTYDLGAPGRDYTNLFKILRSYSSHVRPTKSQWLIDTNESAVQIRDKLLPAIDRTDKLLVVRIGLEAAAHKLDPVVWQWIEQRL